MSFYPTYSLEVYDHVQRRWIPNCSYPSGNAPHHYDYLRSAFERLVASAKQGSLNQAPIGYRIVRANQWNVKQVIDEWCSPSFHDMLARIMASADLP